jgi:hypothetical protein
VVILWGLASGKVGHSVLYGRYGGGFVPTSGIANSILTGLTSGAGWTGLAAFMAATAGLSGIQLRDVATANQPIVSNTVGGQPGTSASPELPDETAVVVTLRTALTGRANRGRLYTAGYATNALGSGNVVAAGAVTALQAWATTISSVLSGQGLTWVLGQRARAAYTGSTGTQHPARAATSTPVTLATVRDNHWDSQRRRGLK